jgi:hypothetical protein
MNSLKNLYHTSIKYLKHLYLKQLPVHIRNWVRDQIENLDFKDITLWIKFLAYALPFSFFLYVLYINYLPFGFERTYTIDVGGPNDTTPSEFYLEPSPDLSERKVDENGNTYRELNGIAYATFKPNVVLKNATVTVSVEGDGVSIIPPVINFNPNDYQWDYNWDFTKGIPEDLKGNMKLSTDSPYWNGNNTRLELPNSQDKFENEHFTVYLEWTPTESRKDSQQIIGHYNWELFQNKTDVKFQIGRTKKTDKMISISHPIDTKTFFNKKHSAIIGYTRGQYIYLYIDGRLAHFVDLYDEEIKVDYGNRNLTLGKSSHGSASNFRGNIYSVMITEDNPLQINRTELSRVQDTIVLNIINTNPSSTLYKISANANKE